ncbi:hypothetical protein [Methylobacterium gossipiicola]|uniref:Uncharacterized protein n=1 Tax=Methylobacterium gossipiicola TaxID=582675 RepID=A0A1I2XD15_9HYPH|nr:hypothetical protein [Methylobacterium gossipiicola]SFH11355.1 hypothetical protein SAMN05192565_13813 [Methylobacterium gossipiicola]
MNRKPLLAWGGLAVAALLLAGSGAELLPQAHLAWRLLRAAEDPPALARLRLAPMATPERVAGEIDTALAAGDEDLARSFLALADERGLPVDSARRARIEAMSDGAPLRMARAFADGALSGQADSGIGLAGAFAADLTGLGDLRDLAREGGHLVRDEPYDPLLLGLASVGLVATAATYAGGLGAVARGGATVLKVAHKSGRLSRSLTASLGRMVRESVNPGAVRVAVAAAGRLDLATARNAARSGLRTGAIAELTALGGQAYTLQARMGARGVMQVLSVARAPSEIGHAVRLAEGLGPATRAVLKLLDRAALVIGAVLMELVRTVWLALGWCWGLTLFCRRLGLAIGRLIWRRPAQDKRKPPQGRAATRVSVTGARPPAKVPVGAPTSR